MATSLPLELWTRILEFLELQDIKKVRLVHRALAAYGQWVVWRTLSLCSIQNHHNAKLLEVLCEPALATYVKQLVLLPSDLHPGFEAGSSERWVHDVTTSLTGLKLFRWKRPLQSWRHLILSRRGSIRAAIGSLPLFTCVNKLTIVASFEEEEERIPHPQLYNDLLPGIQADQLRVLNLQLASSLARTVFSEAFKAAQISFPQLRTLIVNLGERVAVNTSFVEKFKGLVDSTRSSLHALGLKCNTTRSTTESADAFLLTLGYFPQLSQIHFEFKGEIYNRDSFPGFQKFLGQHSRTLTRICIEPAPVVHLTSIIPLSLDQGNNASAPRRLGSLASIYFECDIAGLSLEPQLKTLGQFVDTLTTLIITGTSHSRGLRYSEVQTLVCALYKPPPHGVLRNLKLTVHSLGPGVFDLLAQNLEDLDSLELEYLDIISNDRSNAVAHDEVSPTDSSLRNVTFDGVHVQISFFEAMKTRRYEHWNLRRVDVYRLKPPRSLLEKSGSFLSLLAGLIPSLKEFGMINLSGIKLELDHPASRCQRRR
ncbi:hypothetical protein BDN72DRAFT_894146 [Pluteus cervinus]|uniref:Uncharacterized protein n=1 Tax=Pluteus cervinus TaxID=181527 RepID=A0ACD3B6R1_9AGAR|nr:hypothetical protein BDN72DRAFT_894146 [Pluteus cervinus]